MYSSKIQVFGCMLKMLCVYWLMTVLFTQAYAQLPDSALQTGAARMHYYLPLLEGKRVGLVVNHTSLVGSRHLVDTLLDCGVRILKVFVPEHGLRGLGSAGEIIKDEKDPARGITIYSLYGKNKKPTAEQLADLDCIVFDMQDVGARFYTYISTLHYVMEACAEQGKSLIVLDRPNPNGDYIDGPLLDERFRSFVGMHPIPIVHGLTIGELARMIIGEQWIAAAQQCQLVVVPMQNYSHRLKYKPPVGPSPNLPNYEAIRWYPTLCLFEGTSLSVGRGTDFPFQVVGYPHPAMGSFCFVPEGRPGAMSPPHEGKVCYGLDLRQTQAPDYIALEYIVDMYKRFPNKDKFFNTYFDTLCGTDTVRKQIQMGATAAAIRQSWQKDIEAYRKLREKYLLYD